jgi:GT2 family glycosyltransferase
MINHKILSVSIVAFNTDPTLIINCIETLNLETNFFRATIIDNSSEDYLRITAENLKINYIHTPINLGYGGGHNIAIKQSLSDGFVYHLVINADISFSTEGLLKIINFMNENPNIGQLMPKVLNPDGTIQRLCKLVPTPIDLIVRRFLPRVLFESFRRRFELWDSGYDKIIFVPYLSGCFMFLRCSVLKEIGIFDERFFMYPEDIDLTRRIAIKYDTCFYPFVEVIHEHGAASYKSKHMLIIHLVNIFLYFCKWGWFFDKERCILNEKTLYQFYNKDSL